MKHTFSALDTTRTLLALSVALTHYFYWNGTDSWFPNAFLAVDFFFVLSGFVLCQSVIYDSSATLDEFLSRFVTRRLRRLYPLYALLFVPSAALVIWQHGMADPVYYYFISAALLQSLGFDVGANYIFADTTIGIAWSISIELWVGLAFFPVVFALRRRPLTLCFACVTLAITCLALLANYSPNSMNVNFQRLGGTIITFGSIRGLMGFCCGVVAFISYKLILKTASKSVLVSFELLLIGIAAALFLPKGHDPRNDLLGPAVFAMLISILACEKGYLSKALNWRLWGPARALSYSIYLVHPFCVYLWRQLGLPFSHSLVPLYLALTLVSSAVLYALVEKPSIEWSRSKVQPDQNRGKFPIIRK